MRLTMFDRPRYYVSLGDSISIDAYAGGPGRGAASLLLKNRDEDFPEWQGRDLTTILPGARLIPLAMDGGTTATLRYAQLPRLIEMHIKPEIATITIGGNDLMVAFGNDATAHAAHAAIYENLDFVLTTLRRLMGADAPILVGTVYDPSDGYGTAGMLSLGNWPTALQWLARINDTLRELVIAHGCTVADIHAAFLGHGATVGNVSGSDPRPQNQDLWFCGTIEPNAWGASAVRSIWWENLVALGTIAATSPSR